MALPQDFLDLAKHVNNWGRWGEDDERGTLNLITEDAVRRAGELVRDGRAFSLSIPFSESGPQTGGIPGRVNPERSMIAVNAPLSRDAEGVRFNDDVVTMGLQAATHWDSLAHVTYDGRMYNGFDLGASIDARGASRCGIDKVGVLVSRGVLLDVARAREVERLEGGYAITFDDLVAAESLSGLAVEPGDVVLVRTGQMQLFHGRELKAYGRPSPGLSMETVRWFHERDVAAVATDNMTFEVFPVERDDCAFPVHMLLLVEMGLLQGQNFDLEALSADCEEDGVYEFLLEASPLPFERGLGGPVNPVAVK
ncbi:MAG: cyclase family protein [Actinomycetota bacterium]